MYCDLFLAKLLYFWYFRVYIFGLFIFLFFVLQVFRPLLNISLEFSAEEFETALITPNDTLSDIHIPLLKVGAYDLVV